MIVIQNYMIICFYSHLPFYMIGASCETRCPRGFFGEQCDKMCDCKNKASCRPDTGKCVCERGWHGAHCNTPCPRGKFGVNCNQKCPECFHGNYHHFFFPFCFSFIRDS